MQLEDLLTYLQKHNIQLLTEGQQIRVRAPKNTITPQISQEIAQNREQLLMHLHQKQLYESSRKYPLQKVAIPPKIPLSLNQQRLWFIHKLYQQKDPYNVVRAFEISGQLDLLALEKSISHIIQRHQILRTVFHEDEQGMAYQKITPAYQVQLPIEYTHREILPDERIHQVAYKEGYTSFNLAENMLRFRLLQFKKHHHVLFIIAHHSIFDGTSLSIFQKELVECYDAYTNNRTPILPKLQIQYADFTIWQRTWMDDKTVKLLLNYWKNKLKNLQYLSLPTDFPPPSQPSFRGDSISFTIPQDVLAKFKEILREHKCTLFMGLLTVYKILLSRYSNQKDITVGFPIACRNHPIQQNLIGFVANTVVSHTYLDPQTNFIELLHRVRNSCLEIQIYQDMPFDKLVESMDINREKHHLAIARVSFALQQNWLTTTQLRHVTFAPLYLKRFRSHFDFSLIIYEVDNQLLGHWQYNIDLFQPTTIQNMIQHFTALLHSAVENPQQKIRNMPTDSQKIAKLKTAVVTQGNHKEYPLSFMQEQLWFFYLLNPHSALYNMTTHKKLKGNLHIECLQQAITKLVIRQPSLRTYFYYTDNGHVQQRLHNGSVQLLVDDISTCHDLEKKLSEKLYEHRQIPFDLTTFPLVSFRLIKLGSQEHVLSISMHHIISDGWSIEIIWRELAAFYNALLNKENDFLPALNIQYGDFCIWQREKKNWSLEQTYWKNLFQKLPQPLELPIDFPRPETQTSQGEYLTISIDNILQTKLRNIANDNNSTFFIIMLTAFKALLSRYSRDKDIVVGFPTVNRPFKDLENIVGFFVNTLALHTKLDMNSPFIELLKKVKYNFEQAFSHQEFSFAQLVKLVNPQRHINRNPIFQVMVTTFEFASNPSFTGLTACNLQKHVTTSKFDLTLSIKQQGDLTFFYNKNLFRKSTIEQMAQDFTLLLQSIAANPHTNLTKLVQQQPTNNDTFDLTPNQLSMWLTHTLTPQCPPQTILFSYTIESTINEKIFQQCFCKIVTQCDSLHTQLQEINGEVKQKIQQKICEHHHYLDFSKTPNPQHEVQQWITQQQKIKLHGDQLYRSHLIKLAPRKYQWYLHLSHMIADGYSQIIIARAMSQLYLQHTQNKPLSFSTPSIKDYLINYDSYCRSTQYLHDEKYWQEYMETATERLHFYGQYSSTEITKKSFFNYRLPQNISRKMEKIFQQHPNYSLSATKFNFLASVYFAYLFLIGNRDEICINFPYHNRKQHEFKNTPGFMMTVLPLKLKIHFSDTLTSISEKIAQQVRSHIKHSLYPVRSMQNIDFMFNFQSLEFNEFAGNPVTVENHSTYFNKFALSITVYNYKPNTYDFRFEFSPEIADYKDVVIEHIEHLLTSFVDNPSIPLDKVNLLTPKQCEKVIYDFNKHQKDYHNNYTIKELFEKQLPEVNQQIALCYQEQQLTYKNLNKRGNQLAWYLQEQIGKNKVIAVYAQHHIDTVIAMLAIIKSGNIYCPLDPLLPSQRRQYILKDSQATCVISSSNIKCNIPVISTNAQKYSHYPMHDLPQTSQVTDAVYLIYTSGSTGLPKGVTIHNQNLLPFLLWCKDYWKLGTQTKVLQNLALAFDYSLMEILATIMFGGSLYILPLASLYDLPFCKNFINTHRINTLYTTPSFLEKLIADSHFCFPHLKNIILGGEKLALSLVEKTYAVTQDHCRVYDGYGVTEATINSTITYWHKEKVKLYQRMQRTTIGKVCPGFSIYIVDENLNPVAIGVTGELLIGGDSVATGYWQRPQLTATKFIPDIFTGKGKRLYRTGDAARYLPDGNIEFIGRQDRQVKVNGFRVELGEIESSLQTHSAIDKAVAIIRNNILVAYIVGNETSSEKLNNYLRKKLPYYMIPTTFIPLQQIPLTSRGKIDYSALPDPKKSQAQLLPRNSVETQVAFIFSDILSIDAIGIKDNFFERGGHSLLIVQLANRINNLFKTDIPLLYLFNNPTIEQISQKIQQDTVANVEPFCNLHNVKQSGVVDSDKEKNDSAQQFPQHKLGPRNVVEEKIMSLWHDLLQISSIGVKDNFFDLGGHSLLAVQLVNLINKMFQTKISIPFLFNNPTIEQIAQKIHSDSNNESIVISFQGTDHQPPLFCFPCIGGSGLYLYNFMQSISQDRNCYILQGISNYHTIEDMAQYYIECICKIRSQGPYIIAGHSFGGKIAFEVARQLHIAGEKIHKLIIIDTGPQMKISQTISEEQLFYEIVLLFQKVYNQELVVHRKQLRNLTVAEKIAKLQQCLINSGLLPQGDYSEYLENFVRVYKTQRQTCYSPPKKKYDIPTVLYRPTSKQDNNLLGWNEYLDNMEVMWVEGNHYSIVTPPYNQTIIQHLNSSL